MLPFSCLLATLKPVICSSEHFHLATRIAPEMIGRIDSNKLRTTCVRAGSKEASRLPRFVCFIPGELVPRPSDAQYWCCRSVFYPCLQSIGEVGGTKESERP